MSRASRDTWAPAVGYMCIPTCHSVCHVYLPFVSVMCICHLYLFFVSVICICHVCLFVLCICSLCLSCVSAVCVCHVYLSFVSVFCICHVYLSVHLCLLGGGRDHGLYLNSHNRNLTGGEQRRINGERRRNSEKQAEKKTEKKTVKNGE